MIQLSLSAIQEIRRLATEMAREGQGLRFFVEGSCCGKSYGMGFDDAREEDQVLDFDGVKILVGPESILDIQGLNIDFIEGPEGRGFEILSSHEMNNECCRSDSNSEKEGCCRSDNDSHPNDNPGGCCRH